MKAQEEIMGFMIVVVMVIAIGIGFLFFLMPSQPEVQDLEIRNLLYSWLSATSDGQSVRAEIRECYGTCDLEKSAGILDSVITKSGIMNRINGYSLNITGTTDFYYSKGELKGNSTKTAVVEVDSENRAKLKFYYP